MAFVSMEREGNGVDVDHLRRKRHQRREQLREEESSEEEMGPDTRPLLTCRKCGAFSTRHPPARSNHEKKCLGSAEANAAKLTPWEREKERRRNDPTYVPYQPPPKSTPRPGAATGAGVGSGLPEEPSRGPTGRIPFVISATVDINGARRVLEKLKIWASSGGSLSQKSARRKRSRSGGRSTFESGATSTGTGTPCGPSATSC